MPGRGRPLATAAGLAGLLVGSTPAVAAPDADCLAPLMAEQASVMRAFQTDLADLIAAELPGHAALARLSAELQSALAERRAARATALARWGSDALTVPQDLRGFPWTEAGEARLAAEDPTYSDLARRIEFLGSRNNADPGWPTLRTAYRERVAPLPEHAALVARHATATAALDPLVAACFVG